MRIISYYITITMAMISGIQIDAQKKDVSKNQVIIKASNGNVELSPEEVQYLALLSDPFNTMIANKKNTINLSDDVTQESIFFIQKNMRSLINYFHNSNDTTQLVNALGQLPLESLIGVIVTAYELHINILYKLAITIFGQEIADKKKIAQLGNYIAFHKHFFALQHLKEPKIIQRIKDSVDLSWLINRHMQRKNPESFNIRALAQIYLSWKKKQPYLHVIPNTERNVIALLGKSITVIINLDTQTVVPISFALHDICLNPDNSLIASCFGSQILIINAKNGNLKQKIALNNRTCKKMEWSSCNQLIIVTKQRGDHDKEYITIFDPIQGKEQQSFDPHANQIQKITTSYDGKYLLILNENSLSIWSLFPSPKLINSYPGTITNAQWHPHKHIIAYTQKDNVHVDTIISSHKNMQKLFSYKTKCTIKPNTLAWSYDGHYIAANCAKEINIIDTVTHKEVHHFPIVTGRSILWSPDSKYMAIENNIIDFDSGLTILTTENPIDAWLASGRYIISNFNAITLIDHAFQHALSKLSLLQIELLHYIHQENITELSQLPAHLHPAYNKLPRKIQTLLGISVKKKSKNHYNQFRLIKK